MFARVIQAIGLWNYYAAHAVHIVYFIFKRETWICNGIGGLVIQFARIGPTFSGLIIDNTSWRVPFIIVVGIALVGYIFGAITLSSYNEIKKRVR